MLFLEEAKTIYGNISSETWINELGWDAENLENPFSEGTEKLISASFRLFILLSKSILSGEYVSQIDQTQNVLNTLKDYSAHEEPIYSDDSEEINSMKESLFQSLVSLDAEMKHCIKLYESLLNIVSYKTDLYEHNYVLNGFHLPGTIEENSIFFIFAKLLIPICRKDYTMSYFTNVGEDSVGELIFLWKKINKYNEDILEKNFEILDILSDTSKNQIRNEIINLTHAASDKCVFLLKKMLHVSGESEYSVDFQNGHIRYRDRELDIPLFQEFLDRFEHLHVTADSRYATLHDKIRSERANLSDLILLMKYFRENGGTLHSIDEIINYFNAKYPLSVTDKFNDYALRTIKNYLYNCRFSFILENTEISTENLKDYMSEIEELQFNTGIKNYYPYRKAVKFLVKEIDRLFKDQKNYEYKDEIGHLISSLKVYLVKFKSALKWCRVRHFYPFQLPLSECTISYNELNVFIPSSFTRPIKYDMLNEEYNRNSLQISFFENKLDFLDDKKEIEEVKTTLASIQSGNQQLKIDIRNDNDNTQKDIKKDLDASLEKSENKNKEILGVFGRM